MVQLFNTRSLLKATKLIALVVIGSIFVVPEVLAQNWEGGDLSRKERKAKIQEYYASQPEIKISAEAQAILDKDLSYWGGGEAKRKKAKRKNAILVNDEKIKFGLKLTNGNIGYENEKFTFPYFLTFLLKRFFKDTEYVKWN